MKTREKNRRRGGYTLAEVLTVVALMVVLAAVAIPSVIRYRRDLKLTELDDSARTIFLAAQNHLTALCSAEGGALELGGTTLRGSAEAVPALADGTHLRCVSTNETGAEPGWLVLPGSVESGLTEAGSYYIVEFDPASGTVYGVFYTNQSEGTPLTRSVYQDLCAFSSDGNSCRTRKGRNAFAASSGGFLVGYYGADGAPDMDRPDGQKLPKPKLKLINAEELALEFYGEAEGELDATKVFWSVSVTGKNAAGEENTKTLVDKGSFTSGAASASTVVLDTLKEGDYSRFPSSVAYGGWTVGDRFADWADGAIVPGGDVTVTVTLWYQPDSGEGIAALPQSASRTTNSLFAARNGERVELGYGRHLQNLGLAGLDSAITTAVQARDIDFARNTPAVNGDEREYWDETYGHDRLLFVPIDGGQNSLTEFDGGGFVIQGLNASVNDSRSGLFARLTRGAVKNVTLVDGVTSNASVSGTLAATAQKEGDAPIELENCKVYLTQSSDTSPRVRGTQAGGLLGYADGVTVTDSFASTVVQGQSVGGLAGVSNATFRRCYAAGRLSGTDVGGLVGSSRAGARYEDCYAAGTILSATGSAAGLTQGSGSARRCYAALELFQAPEGGAVYGAVSWSDDQSNCFYLIQPGLTYTRPDGADIAGVTAVRSTKTMRKDNQLAALGTAFQESGTGTEEVTPYNFPAADGPRDPQLAAPYPYPTLTGLDHYGDWLVAEPPGALLAYYEIDASGGLTFSFFDGGVERGNLDGGTGAILEDGYAYLSRTRLTDDQSIWLALGDGGSFTQRSGTYLGALNEDCSALVDDTAESAVYFAYELPALDDEVAGLGGGFYLRVQAASDEAGQNDLADGWLNPHFGREAHNNVARPVKTDNVHIRSIRHLNNIRRYGKLNYLQERDIDGGSYRGYEGRDESYQVTVAGMKAIAKSWEGKWTDGIWDLSTEHRLAFEPIYAIGEEGEISGLNGTYDGGGRTIRNLVIGSYTHADKSINAGLFFRQNEGYLKNIVLTDCQVNGTSGSDSYSSGILVGRSEGRIENCVVRDCALSITGSAKGEAGGLVGYAEKGCVIDGCAVENCQIDGGNSDFDQKTGVYNVGGLAGYVSSLSGAITNCSVTDTTVTNGYVYEKTTSSLEKWGSVGGFIGVWKSGNGAVRDCVVQNTAVTGNQRVGGFIGTLSAGSAGTLEGCEAVNVAVTGKYAASPNGTRYTNGAGGFAGVVSEGVVRACGARLDKTASTLAINTLYNQQCVTSQWDGGGFAGALTGGQMTNCYAAVKVSGQNAGGFAGEMTAGAVASSYAGGHTQSGKYAASLPNVTGAAQAGGFIGLWNGGTATGCYTTCAVTGPNDNAADVFANVSADGVTAGVTPTGGYALGTAFVSGKNRGSLTETSAAVSMTELDEAERTETTVYDTSLTERYPYQPVRDAEGNPLRHYGDWPSKKSSGANRDWIQQIAEPEDGTTYENFSAAVDWAGDTLNLTFDVQAVAGEQNAANTGPNHNGFYAVTTDLGYKLIFRIVYHGDTEEYEIQGIENATVSFSETATMGTDNRHIVLNFTIPTDQIPPYKETISISAMDVADVDTQQPEKFVMSGIANSDPSYHGVEGKALDATITIDGDFSDWEGYEHQLMEGLPAGEQTPLDGHWSASILGYENKIFVHMINEDVNDFSDPWGLLNFTITAQDREGNALDLSKLEMWRLLNTAITVPGVTENTVQQELNGYWDQDLNQWVAEYYDLFHYIFVATEDRLEYELEIDLDEWAKIIGVESGDVFGEVKLDSANSMRDLEAKRDPEA